MNAAQSAYATVLLYTLIFIGTPLAVYLALSGIFAVIEARRNR